VTWWYGVLCCAGQWPVHGFKDFQHCGLARTSIWWVATCCLVVGQAEPLYGSQCLTALHEQCAQLTYQWVHSSLLPSICSTVQTDRLCACCPLTAALQVAPVTSLVPTAACGRWWTLLSWTMVRTPACCQLRQTRLQSAASLCCHSCPGRG
jgi:hypothetical protein